MGRKKDKTMVSELFVEYQKVKSLHNSITDMSEVSPLMAFYDADECLDDIKQALTNCIERPWDVRKHYDSIDREAIENLFSNFEWIQEKWHEHLINDLVGSSDDNDLPDLPF